MNFIEVIIILETIIIGIMDIVLMVVVINDIKLNKMIVKVTHDQRKRKSVSQDRKGD